MLPRAVLELSQQLALVSFNPACEFYKSRSLLPQLSQQVALLAAELESLYLIHTQSLAEAEQQQLVIGVLEPVKIDLFER